MRLELDTSFPAAELAFVAAHGATDAATPLLALVTYTAAAAPVYDSHVAGQLTTICFFIDSIAHFAADTSSETAILKSFAGHMALCVLKWLQRDRLASDLLIGFLLFFHVPIHLIGIASLPPTRCLFAILAFAAAFVVFALEPAWFGGEQTSSSETKICLSELQQRVVVAHVVTHALQKKFARL